MSQSHCVIRWGGLKKMKEAEKEIKELESNGWRKISHVRREPPLEFYFLFERMIK